MINAQPKARSRGPKPEIGFPDNPISYYDAGIDKNLADRARDEPNCPILVVPRRRAQGRFSRRLSKLCKPDFPNSDRTVLEQWLIEDYWRQP
jgi:hypothetical protein